jgi:hypothetical protein
VVGFGLTVALLFALRQSAADWRQLPREAFHLDLAPLAASWGVQTVGWLLAVLNWRRILRGVGGSAGPRYTDHLRAHTWSALGNVVPGSVWLPASRVLLYRQMGESGLAVSGAVVVEWLLVGLAGVLLYLASAPFATATSRVGLALLVVAAAGALVVLHPRVLHRLMRGAAARLGAGSAAVAQAEALGARTTAVLLARELVVLVLSGIGFYLMMVAIAPRADLADALSAWALSVAVANLLAWLPATLLFRDGAMAVVLVPLYDGSLLVALGVVLAWRLWMTVVLLSWAGLAALAGRVRGGDRTAERA